MQFYGTGTTRLRGPLSLHASLSDRSTPAKPKLLTLISTHSCHVFLGFPQPLRLRNGRKVFGSFDTERGILSIQYEPSTAKDCRNILNAELLNLAQLKTAPVSCFTNWTPSHQLLSASKLWWKMSYILSFRVLWRSWSWTHWEVGPAVGGTSRSSLLGHSNSTLSSHSVQPIFQLGFINERKLTSIISYTIVSSNVLVCVVQLFDITKTPSPLQPGKRSSPL